MTQSARLYITEREKEADDEEDQGRDLYRGI